ncbi:hypothetical protein KC19_4G179700 [Ceratodon purpureus]|uniref:Uncharacterized protein n=1 Tax=Ceratodon purpureus TaxID=3225 RepID=A0A8T0ICA2_CERPU|nr:hypothetical protein KC19_4G179700 [Ceratodon purpureus]
MIVNRRVINSCPAWSDRRGKIREKPGWSCRSDANMARMWPVVIRQVEHHSAHVLDFEGHGPIVIVSEWAIKGSCLDNA